jgi:hypothetical protein
MSSFMAMVALDSEFNNPIHAAAAAIFLQLLATVRARRSRRANAPTPGGILASPYLPEALLRQLPLRDKQVAPRRASTPSASPGLFVPHSELKKPPMLQPLAIDVATEHLVDPSISNFGRLGSSAVLAGQSGGLNICRSRDMRVNVMNPLNRRAYNLSGTGTDDLMERPSEGVRIAGSTRVPDSEPNYSQGPGTDSRSVRRRQSAQIRWHLAYTLVHNRLLCISRASSLRKAGNSTDSETRAVTHPESQARYTGMPA